MQHAAWARDREATKLRQGGRGWLAGWLADFLNKTPCRAKSECLCIGCTSELDRKDGAARQSSRHSLVLSRLQLIG